MAERLTLQPLDWSEMPAADQEATACRIQELIYNDFRRVGIDEAVARTIADPNNDDKVEAQWERIASPDEGVVYGGLYENSELLGVVKTGFWLHGDAEPFGAVEKTRALAEELFASPESRTRGLHAFSAEVGLAKSGLIAVRQDKRFVPASAALKAAVHENDTELDAAFLELGAPWRTRTGVKKLGESAAVYTLRKLKPIAHQ